MGSLTVATRDDTESLLCRWGSWAKVNTVNVGFPNMTPFRRLAGQQVGSAPLSDDDAVLVDAVISELGITEPEAQKVARYYYIGNMSIRQIVRATGYKKSAVQSHKDLVVTWVTAKFYNPNI